jgi:hypothetical protein
MAVLSKLVNILTGLQSNGMTVGEEIFYLNAE